MGLKGSVMEFVAFLIDYGSCLRSGSIAEIFGGTPQFASISSMENKPLFCKDDIGKNKSIHIFNTNF